MPTDDPIDEIFGAFEDGSALADLEAEQLSALHLPVDPVAVERVTDRLQRRLAPSRLRTAMAITALLAASALFAAALRSSPPTVPPQPETTPHVADVAPAPAPAPPPLTNPAPAPTLQAIQQLLDDGRFVQAADRFDAALRDGALQGMPVLKLSLALHQAARTDGLPAETRARLQESVEDGYDSWLTANPDHDKALEIHYALAELLYSGERFEEAYEHYATVAAHPEHRRARFCANSALFAAEKLLDAQPPRAEGQLTRWDRNFVDAVDLYAALEGDPGKRAQARYRAAFLLYEAEHFDEAMERFGAVIAEVPEAREAEMASMLVIDSLVQQERWAAIEQQALAYAAAGLGDPDEMLLIAASGAFEALSTDPGAAPADWQAWLDAYPSADAEQREAAAKRAAP